MQKGSATTNAILVILLVIIVGFAVWYVTIREHGTSDDDKAGLQINLGGSNNGGTPPPSGY